MGKKGGKAVEETIIFDGLVYHFATRRTRKKRNKGKHRFIFLCLRKREGGEGKRIKSSSPDGHSYIDYQPRRKGKGGHRNISEEGDKTCGGKGGPVWQWFLFPADLGKRETCPDLFRNHLDWEGGEGRRKRDIGRPRGPLPFSRRNKERRRLDLKWGGTGKKENDFSFCEEKGGLTPWWKSGM